jgi:hypothetical protein
MRRALPKLVALCVPLALLAGCKKKSPLADAAAAAAAPVSPVQPAVAPPAPKPAAPPRNPGMDDPLFKLLPKKAAVAFVLPRLEESGRLVKAHLERFASALGFAGKVDDLLRSAAMGVANPFDATSRQRWAIDGKRSAAVALDPEGKASVIVLAVSSFEAFDKHFREKMKGATFEESLVPAGKIYLIKRGGAPVMAYAHREGYAFITPSEEGVDAKATLEAFLKATPAESLASTANFQASAGRLASFEDALFYFDGDGLYQLQALRSGAVSEDEKRNLRRIYDVLRAFAISVDLTEKDIRAELYAHLDQASQWAPILAGAADFPLGRFLEAGSGVVAKLSVDGPKLLEKVLSLDPGTKTKLARTATDLERRLGVNLDKDLLRNFTGRFSAAFLGVEKDIAAAVASPKRRLEVFHHLHLVGAAELRDAGALREAVSKARDFLRKRTGARLALTEKDHGGLKYWELSFLKARIFSAALLENVLVVTTGKGRMERTLDLVAKKGAKSLLEEVEPAVKQALASASNAVLHVNLAALLSYVQALDLRPLGKRGALMRTFIRGKLSAILGKLADATAVLRFDGQGVRLEATLRGK